MHQRAQPRLPQVGEQVAAVARRHRRAFAVDEPELLHHADAGEVLLRPLRDLGDRLLRLLAPAVQLRHQQPHGQEQHGEAAEAGERHRHVHAEHQPQARRQQAQRAAAVQQQRPHDEAHQLDVLRQAAGDVAGAGAVVPRHRQALQVRHQGVLEVALDVARGVDERLPRDVAGHRLGHRQQQEQPAGREQGAPVAAGHHGVEGVAEQPRHPQHRRRMGRHERRADRDPAPVAPQQGGRPPEGAAEHAEALQGAQHRPPREAMQSGRGRVGDCRRRRWCLGCSAPSAPTRSSPHTPWIRVSPRSSSSRSAVRSASPPCCRSACANWSAASGRCSRPASATTSRSRARSSSAA